MSVAERCPNMASDINSPETERENIKRTVQNLRY